MRMASESTTLASTSPSSRAAAAYACVRCSDRKVRCDRQSPCSACVRHNVQCVFRAPLPPRRRKKRVESDILKDKLKHYEALFQRLGLDPNGLPNTSEAQESRTISGSGIAGTEDLLRLPTPASTTTELERRITTSQLLHGQGKSKFVDNSLWSRMVEEFHDPEEALDDSSYESSDATTSVDDLSFVLGVARTPKTGSSHPPTEHIHQMWQIFIDNVDPLTKIVHVPSLQPAIQRATTDIERIPRSFEALMFAIYTAAVMSLKDEDCKRRLSEPRDTLLSRYTSATKSALTRAKFMGTSSLVVLQAVVLHLFTVRNTYGPRTVWTLTGAVIRIAEGMGLHRDGSSFGVPPFESEIRRRVWWQLKMHDFRTAELGGLSKFRAFQTIDDTCEAPSNIDDGELYPGMSSPAISSTKLTDMVFFALRLELATFAMRNGARFLKQEKDVSQWDDLMSRIDQSAKDEYIKEIEEIMETKYLRYCDPSQPLQLMTMLVARSSLNLIRFMTCHPRRWVSQEQMPETERAYVWKTTVALLEQYDIMQSDRRLQGFAWYVAYFTQWHILIHALDTLRAQPLMPDAEKTWRLIEATYENNPDMISNTTKPIHVAVGNLCLKAFNAYEAAFRDQGRSISAEPDFITKLRQQREAAKARSEARDERSKEAAAVHGSELPQVVNLGTEADPGIVLPNEVFDPNEPQQDASSEFTNLNPSSENDPFWLTSGLEDGLYGPSDDIMVMDTDFMMAQDYGLEDANGQSISWTQWDALLSEATAAHANGGARSGFTR